MSRVAPSSLYWVTQKLPQICTEILRICIGKVAWFAVYICDNFWVTQYKYLYVFIVQCTQYTFNLNVAITEFRVQLQRIVMTGNLSGWFTPLFAEAFLGGGEPDKLYEIYYQYKQIGSSYILSNWSLDLLYLATCNIKWDKTM